MPVTIRVQEAKEAHCQLALTKWISMGLARSLESNGNRWATLQALRREPPTWAWNVQPPYRRRTRSLQHRWMKQ